MRKYLIILISCLLALQSEAQEIIVSDQPMLIAQPAEAMPQDEPVADAVVADVSAADTMAVMPQTAPVVTQQVTVVQQLKFAVVSIETVLKQMPGYAEAESDYQELVKKYEIEQKASADEFNAKYQSFLDNQHNYAPSILRKRQLELEDMMKRNELFRIETNRLLKEARADFFKPLRQRINTMLNAIATEEGYAFVLNTDAEAVPFVNPENGVNITETLLVKLK